MSTRKKKKKEGGKTSFTVPCWKTYCTLMSKINPIGVGLWRRIRAQLFLTNIKDDSVIHAYQVKHLTMKTTHTASSIDILARSI